MAGKRSLEEELYASFYNGYERDAAGNSSLSGTLLTAGNYLRYVTGTAALFLGGNLVRKTIKGERMTRRQFIEGAGLTTAAAGLTLHFQKAYEIFTRMYQKNTSPEGLTDEEKSDTRTDGALGRTAHHISAAGIGVTIVAHASTSRRRFLTFTPFLAFAPFWYRCTIHDGYGALYNSAVDYTTDVRREMDGSMEGDPPVHQSDAVPKENERSLYSDVR